MGKNVFWGKMSQGKMSWGKMSLGKIVLHPINTVKPGSKNLGTPQCLMELENGAYQILENNSDSL